MSEVSILDKDYEIARLREELNAEKATHTADLKERDDHIRELENLNKAKWKAEEVVETEYKSQYFSKFVITMMDSYKISQRLKNFYIDHIKFLNYAFVCGGIGIPLNMAAYFAYSSALPGWLANLLAVLTVMVSNFTLSLGSLGYLFGLAPKTVKKAAPI